jgi:hypothetical protein
MDSIADKFNSLAKESIVFRRFHSFYISIDPGVFKQHMWCSGTRDISGVVVFGIKNNHGRKTFGFVSINAQAFTLQ